MKKRIVFLAFVLLVSGSLFFQNTGFFTDIKNFLAGVFFTDSATERQLKNDYQEAKAGREKIKILIVPGHDDDYWGTEFGGVKEADLNLALAENLFDFLKQKKEFEVFLARDKNGYRPDLSFYFKQNKKEIEKFVQKNVEITNSYIDSGVVKRYTQGVIHNVAPEEVILKLYGINKWANENKIDIVIHVHFNDDPERNYSGSGQYTGFAIYVPEKQFSNAKGSMSLAQSVFGHLKKYISVSDLPKEKKGIVEDQKLIAVGSYNTLDAAALLIEYGYIYESPFINRQIRPLVLKEIAFQTSFGVKNFFESEKENDKTSAVLPYTWKENLEKGMKNDKDIFILQAALVLKDIYPPKNFPENGCPLSGNFGDCTISAVKEFQRQYGIEPASGFVGVLGTDIWRIC